MEIIRVDSSQKVTECWLLAWFAEAHGAGTFDCEFQNVAGTKFGSVSYGLGDANGHTVAPVSEMGFCHVASFPCIYEVYTKIGEMRWQNEDCVPLCG
jgi:hypothetical protein